MSIITTIANLKGPQGIQGIPGTGSATTDVATAALINAPTSAVAVALADRVPVGVNVKAFGAKGDKVTDDTAAIQSAINYAQTLVRDAASPTFNKQQDGATVYFPKGMYKISSTLLVSESDITLVGESAAASVLYAPSATFDLVKFYNVSYAVYNNGVRNLRFSTPGNATAGYHLTIMNAIYFSADNLLFNGWFGGLRIVGGGKLMFRGVMFSQETRADPATTTGPAVLLDTDAANSYTGDVHFTDVQIMENIAYAGVNCVVIKGADGIYFNNCHLHGTVSVEPAGAVPIYTLVFNSVYFDSSRDVCVNLSGNPINGYQDIRFNNCYFRAGIVGLRFSATRMMKSVIVANCLFAQNKLNAIEMTNANQQDVVITGCIFENNNTNNDGNISDVQIIGDGIMLSNSVFSGGSAIGYGVFVGSTSGYVTLSNVGFATSAIPQPKRILNQGPNTGIRGIVGWNIKTKGVAAVTSGVTTFVVTHGCAVLPTLQSITLTPGANCPAYWVTAITDTTFTINFVSATSAAFSMAYAVNMES